jgi:hypothetical protein
VVYVMAVSVVSSRSDLLSTAHSHHRTLLRQCSEMIGSLPEQASHVCLFLREQRLLNKFDTLLIVLKRVVSTRLFTSGKSIVDSIRS